MLVVVYHIQDVSKPVQLSIYPSAARMLTRATTSPGLGFFERALPTTVKHRKIGVILLIASYTVDCGGVIVSD